MGNSKDKEENKLYKTKLRLDKVKSVRLMISRAVNRFNEGLIDYKDLRAIGYISGKLLDCFEVERFDERLSELEELLENEQK